jgi:hypothetical protein
MPSIFPLISFVASQLFIRAMRQNNPLGRPDKHVDLAFDKLTLFVAYLRQGLFPAVCLVIGNGLIDKRRGVALGIGKRRPRDSLYKQPRQQNHPCLFHPCSPHPFSPFVSFVYSAARLQRG